MSTGLILLSIALILLAMKLAKFATVVFLTAVIIIVLAKNLKKVKGKQVR